METSTLPESVLRIVEDVLKFIRWKNRLNEDEWEDFHSWVWLRLVESNYKVLRKYENRGSLRTYLNTSLHRLLLDYRVQKWGKWRPSAKAQALGPDVVKLEFYLLRHGFTVQAAVRTVIENHGSLRTEDELIEIAGQLPMRGRGREDAEDWVDRIASNAPTPEGEIRDRETEARRERLLDCLERALSERSPEDRVILKMRFEQNRKLNEVARAIGARPKSFYRRFERLLRALRKSLEEDGLEGSFLESVFPEPHAGGSFEVPAVRVDEPST